MSEASPNEPKATTVPVQTSKNRQEKVLSAGGRQRALTSLEKKLLQARQQLAKTMGVGSKGMEIMVESKSLRQFMPSRAGRKGTGTTPIQQVRERPKTGQVPNGHEIQRPSSAAKVTVLPYHTSHRQLFGLSLLKTSTQDWERDKTLFYTPIGSASFQSPSEWERTLRRGSLKYPPHKPVEVETDSKVLPSLVQTINFVTCPPDQTTLKHQAVATSNISNETLSRSWTVQQVADRLGLHRESVQRLMTMEPEADDSIELEEEDDSGDESQEITLQEEGVQEVQEVQEDERPEEKKEHSKKSDEGPIPKLTDEEALASYLGQMTTTNKVEDKSATGPVNSFAHTRDHNQEKKSKYNNRLQHLPLVLPSSGAMPKETRSSARLLSPQLSSRLRRSARARTPRAKLQEQQASLHHPKLSDEAEIEQIETVSVIYNNKLDLIGPLDVGSDKREHEDPDRVQQNLNASSLTASPTMGRTASPTRKGISSPVRGRTASPTRKGTSSPVRGRTASPTRKGTSSPRRRGGVAAVITPTSQGPVSKQYALSSELWNPHASGATRPGSGATWDYQTGVYNQEQADKVAVISEIEALEGKRLRLHHLINGMSSLASTFNHHNFSEDLESLRTISLQNLSPQRYQRGYDFDGNAMDTSTKMAYIVPATVKPQASINESSNIRSQYQPKSLDWIQAQDGKKILPKIPQTVDKWSSGKFTVQKVQENGRKAAAVLEDLTPSSYETPPKHLKKLPPQRSSEMLSDLMLKLQCAQKDSETDSDGKALLLSALPGSPLLIIESGLGTNQKFQGMMNDAWQFGQRLEISKKDLSNCPKRRPKPV